MSSEDKIDAALSEADDEFESANWHDCIGLAGNVFAAVKPLVAKRLHVELARKIAKSATGGI